ncbi:MAG: carbohydrate kinase family protein [Alistipes sp.]|nr:carbohydrate kinase family protein [Alistipes sp.]
MRRGIISAGNWLSDTIKFISHYPAVGNLVTIEKIDQGFGGCAHNVLADLARMQTGIPLYAGGCVGKDALGDEIFSTCEKLGINAEGICRVDAATSYTDVMADMSNGTRTFFHHRGANAEFGPEHVEKITAEAKIFHLGYLLLLDRMDAKDEEYGVVAARVLDGLQKRGYKTSVDVVSEEGNRFREVILPCLPYMDYFIVNEVEAGACFGRNLRDAEGNILLDEVKAAARFLMESGVGEAVAIHFPEGGYGLRKSGEECYEPSFRVEPKDIVSSVGAGDAFCAAMLYALHEELPLSKSLRVANAAARFNLFSATSTDGAPTIAEIEEFLSKQ